jgi:hypothetical protein
VKSSVKNRIVKAAILLSPVAVLIATTAAIGRW